MTDASPRVETVAVTNTLYGPMVTTAGLLPGADHLAALEAYRDFDLALVSERALNDQGLFLDDMSLAELRNSLRDLRVEASRDVVDVLSREAAA